MDWCTDGSVIWTAMATTAPGRMDERNVAFPGLVRDGPVDRDVPVKAASLPPQSKRGADRSSAPLPHKGSCPKFGDWTNGAGYVRIYS